jgi:hypothetical protein
MITNEQMQPNRYAHLAYARKMHREITQALACGGAVVVANYQHAVQFDKPTQAELFKVKGARVIYCIRKKWYTLIENGYSLEGIRIAKPRGWAA